jgi:hypothetical protein
LNASTTTDIDHGTGASCPRCHQSGRVALSTLIWFREHYLQWRCDTCGANWTTLDPRRDETRSAQALRVGPSNDSPESPW